MLGYAVACRVKGGCVVGHARNRLEDDSIMCCVLGGCTPAEWTMARHQHRRSGERVDFRKALQDGVSGVQNVVATYFVGGQLLSHRHWAVEVVGMGGAVGRDLPASLRPGRGELRVGMDNH